MGEAAAAAKARHPASRSPDPTPLTARIEARLTQLGFPFATEAADAIAARGRTGLDRADFAARLGITAEWLEDIESGGVPVDAWPVTPVEIRRAAMWGDRAASSTGRTPPRRRC